jgi:hypothetical protein
MNARKMVNSVKFGIYKERVFGSFLGASSFFLVCYLILMLLSVSPAAISAIAALLFFITEMVAKSKKGALLVVEEKYPQMYEELRTVNDNLSKDNELIEALKAEAGGKVKKYVDLGDFIDFRKVMSRMLYIFMLSFTIILLASLNIRIPGVGEVIGYTHDFILDLSAKIGADAGEKMNVVNSKNDLMMKFKKLALTAGIAAGEQSGGEIFGSSEVIQLGNEKINIAINPTDFEVDVNDFTAPERKDFAEKPFEDEVKAETTYGFEEKIPVKRQEIVRRYFKKLAES